MSVESFQDLAVLGGDAQTTSSCSHLLMDFAIIDRILPILEFTLDMTTYTASQIPLIIVVQRATSSLPTTLLLSLHQLVLYLTALCLICAHRLGVQ
jgi:hypothetical protein